MANILRGLFRGLWDEVLVELLRGGFRGGREIFAERVKSYITTNPRAALVVTLLSLEPEGRANLMEAHRRAMREGWENRFVLELGQALPRKPDGSVDEEKAREVLKQLNEVSSEELRQFLEFLNHDPIAQWVRYWVLGKGQEVVVGMAEALAELAARGVNVAEKFPGWVSDTAGPAVRQANSAVDDSILDFLSDEKRPWWLRPSRKRHRQIATDLEAREREIPSEVDAFYGRTGDIIFRR